jgi:hypothetical protein
MGMISILDKDFITQYSYAISYGKITEELLYYKQIYQYTELMNSANNFRLPNLEKYKDITDLSNFHQLGKIVLQKNFETSFRNVVKFNNSLSHPKDPQHLYPIAVRYISSDGVYYIERPPFQVEVDSNFSRKSSTSFPPLKIWIPWTILVFNPKDPTTYYFYFSHKSLSSMKDMYFPCFLPNIYDDGRICMGSSASRIPTDTNSIKNIKLIYSNIINEYMSGGWNTDLSPKHDLYLSYNKHSSRLTQDKYPTLYAFNNPTFEYIKTHYPKMRDSTIVKLINHETHNRYRTQYFHSFKYYFLMMNTFDLETTLNFYSELSDYVASSNHPYHHKSFESIVEKIDDGYSIHNPYSTMHNMTSSLSRYLLSQNSSENLLTSETKNIYFIYPFSQNLSNNPSDTNFIDKEIFHQLISKSFSSGDHKKVFHLDLSRKQIEQEIIVDPSIKVSEYYLNHLRSINAKDANV